MKHSEKLIRLPKIINGKRYDISKNDDILSIVYGTNTEVQIPKISDADIASIKRAEKYPLHDVPVQEIVLFLNKIGRFWLPENAGHPIYQEALRNLMLINGYDQKMALRELNIISSVCTNHTGLHDLLDLELGNRFYMEEWVARGDALVHAEPVGNILNIMVGNVPVSGIMSIVRCLLTKNRILAKLPKRDTITTLFFALSMLEINAEHPVTKSMTICYWKGGDIIEDKLISLANLICVWGGKEVIESIKQKTKLGIDILEFGPKNSFSLIGKESVDDKKMAIALAHDVSIYNQEACFSPQMVFVEGDHEVFCKNLKEGLDLYINLLPKAKVIEDIYANVTKTKLEILYKGGTIIESKEPQAWTIAVVESPSEIVEHPLNRFIFVIPVDNIKNCYPYVHPKIQTVTISPWSRNCEVRDYLTLNGVSKMTEVGMVESIRNGSTHDNIYPIQRMVRWVSVERGSDYWGKYILEGPVDTTKWLMMHESLLESIKL
jgi:long-chain-fatty-acyl-CoA reductase